MLDNGVQSKSDLELITRLLRHNVTYSWNCYFTNFTIFKRPKVRKKVRRI